ncbi:alpha/beta hydrolase family protein [Tsukamurella soli]|uniref:Dienelactone hydrolase family protein n=1 Tax=Tsukamurella soli TaxID=644556 RepID=A0ABP8JG73_9ACTN
MTWFSLDEPGAHPRAVAILAHGAGGNRDQAILTATAGESVLAGLRVVRIDLPFRRRRPKGPPSPSGQAADRAAFAEATERFAVDGVPTIWGGQSYGGRMASMAAAGVDGGDGPAPSGLLLLSYPLHPPGKPEKARTEHLPRIAVPTVFVHGRRDPFASEEELAAAAALIPAPTRIVTVAAAHDLAPAKSGAPRLAAEAVADFLLPALGA